MVGLGGKALEGGEWELALEGWPRRSTRKRWTFCVFGARAAPTPLPSLEQCLRLCLHLRQHSAFAFARAAPSSSPSPELHFRLC